MKNFFKNISLYFKTIDFWILSFCITASSISCVCLYSIYQAGFYPSKKQFLMQVITSALGALIAFGLANFDYHLMAKLWFIHAPITLFLVLLTFVIGIQVEGADDRAWLNIGFTTLQPAELLKLSFVLTFALHLFKVKDHMNSFKVVLLLCLHAIVPIGLIVKQGDFGTALVFIFIFLFMIFAAGLPKRYIFIGAGLIATLLPIFWKVAVPDYLKARFMITYDLESAPLGDGYQQLQGKIALGSGELRGRGLFADGLYNVPECYNDFMFSYIGQTLGFIGCISVLIILTLLCIKVLMTAIKAKDALGSYICIGVFAIIFTQSLINIFMVLCIAPVIGITLPFFSAGGSSMTISYISIGMVMSVYKHTHSRILLQG